MKTPTNHKDLQRLGLTEREAKVYLALVRCGPLVPKQIPTTTSIPQGKVYGILHGLQNRGLVTECTINLKKHFEAVRPDDVVHALFMEHEQKYNIARQLRSRLEEQMMSVFNEVRGTPSAQSYFTFLLNPAQILRTLKELHEKAREKILAFTKGPYVMKVEGPSSDDFQTVAMRRGVSCRSIYEGEELRDNRDVVQYILLYARAGEEARVYPRLDIKLMIFDQQFTIFQFLDKYLPEHHTSILVDNEGVTRCFIACFEYYWQKSIPIMEFLSSLTPGAESVSANNGAESPETQAGC
jgi:sugar-specific transcriptional regulator TrmB